LARTEATAQANVATALGVADAQTQIAKDAAALREQFMAEVEASLASLAPASPAPASTPAPGVEVDFDDAETVADADEPAPAEPAPAEPAPAVVAAEPAAAEPVRESVTVEAAVAVETVEAAGAASEGLSGKLLKLWKLRNRVTQSEAPAPAAAATPPPGPSSGSHITFCIHL